METLSKTMCTARQSGASASMRFRNFLNSSARRRAVMAAMTFPDAVSRAA